MEKTPVAKQVMLKFVQIDRDMPDKRDSSVRREDFDEIYAEFNILGFHSSLS